MQVGGRFCPGFCFTEISFIVVGLFHDLDLLP